MMVENTPSNTFDWRIPAWFRRVGMTSWLFLGVVGAVAVLSLLISLTAAITVPILLGAFLAVVFAPMVDWLDSHGLGRALSALAVLIGLVVLILGISYMVIAALVEQSDAIVATLDAAVETIKDWLAGTSIDPSTADDAESTISSGGSSMMSGIASGVVALGGTVAALGAGLVLGTIVLYYLLKDGVVIISDSLARRKRDDERKLLGDLIQQSAADIRAYMRGRTLIALSNGVVIGLAALVLGVPAAAAIAAVNFVGAYIPYLGAFVAGAFAVLMALGEGGIGLAIALLFITLGVNLLLENLLEPLLVGRNLKIHPLLVLLATAFGGMVAGLVGLVLAAPALAVFLDVKREFAAAGFFDESVVADD